MVSERFLLPVSSVGVSVCMCVFVCVSVCGWVCLCVCLCVCVCVVGLETSPTQPVGAQTPAECPAVQASSDTIHREIHQVPQVKGSVLQDCPPPPSPAPSDALRKCRWSSVLLTNRLSIRGSHEPLLGFD